MKKVVSEVFATKMVDFALRFGTGVLITRALGPTDKGVFTFASLVVNWVVLFGNFSFMDANIYFMGSRQYSMEQATTTSILAGFVSGLAYAVILFGLVFLHLVKWPVGNAAAFFLLLTTIPFNLVLNNCGSVIQGLSRFRAYNVFTVLRSVIFIPAVLLALVLSKNRLIGICMALVATNLINAIGISWYLMTRCERRTGISGAYLKAALGYGVRSHLRLVLSQLSIQFDQFMLGILMTASDLGCYSVAASLREGLLLLPESISVVLFPRVASDQASGAVTAARVSRITLVAVLVASAGIAVVAHPLVRLLYGRAFLPAVRPLYFLLIGSVFRSFSRILINYIYGMGRPQLSIWSTGGAACVGLILAYPMIKIYGMVGAALTSALANGAGAFIDLMIARRLSSLPVSKFIVPESSDVQTLTKGNFLPWK